MFTKKDVAEYYNTTQNHYLKWWNLNQSLSLHYGIWDDRTKSFADSLENTNRIMLDLASITHSHQVLDAGCGVGGAAFYINNKTGSSVTGISLSKKQIDFAQRKTKAFELDSQVSFEVMDYTQTTFKDNTFDIIWACESISSVPNKLDFIIEAHRLLKKGGRLVLSDFFLNNENQRDTHNWIRKWGNTWGISNFISNKNFIKELTSQGFSIQKNLNYTPQISKSAKRMYHASLAGAIPSVLYNLTHPKVSKFAKTHYLSGYYQYKALKAQLWKYQLMLAVK